MTTTSQLAEQFESEAAALDREIDEIDMLVAQAQTEAGHHQTRRASAADKLATIDAGASAKDVHELANQVVTLTRRSALMDAQLEILEGKKRATARLQEAIRSHATRLRGLDQAAGDDPVPRSPTAGQPNEPGEDEEMPPAVSRLVLSAQEDLRREIARAMHDGPAQSLTNIVLQAEIVERLVAREPKSAAAEVRQLVAMVQSTLEATKTFIFDVRPMVLDDLGLVPTLRRSARDRGARAGITVEFESIGVDRRLAADTESGLFRIADEALAAYLAARPDRATLGIDWGETLVITLRAEKNPKAVPALDVPAGEDQLPPALAEMLEDRRTQHAAAVERARAAALVKLPARLLRDLAQRAETLGIGLTVLEDGGVLRLSAGVSTVVDSPAPG